MRPNKPIQGTLIQYSGGREVSFYLSTLDTMSDVEISARKINERETDVVLYVSTKPGASKTNNSWMDHTVADGKAEIELRNDHPDYCNNCMYYVAIFMIDQDENGNIVEIPYEPQHDGMDVNALDKTKIELLATCADGMCASCEQEGFDPSKECKDCLPGYFGAECKPCDSCHHGQCESGIHGSGQCVCDEGWTAESKCTDCAAGYWGMSCEACPNCENGGKCSVGGGHEEE